MVKFSRQLVLNFPPDSTYLWTSIAETGVELENKYSIALTEM